eukprot:2599629-Pleurochrysis_carterae.AAC.2
MHERRPKRKEASSRRPGAEGGLREEWVEGGARCYQRNGVLKRSAGDQDERQKKEHMGHSVRRPSI